VRPPAPEGRRPRKKGRPKATDPRVGREEIVAAACEILQTTPISKLTSAAVARKVGVHPALINYYFKNRTELLVAVATGLMQELRAATDFGSDPAAGLEGSLRKRLAGVIGFHRRYPFVHRLIVDEVLNSTSPSSRPAFEAMTSVGLQGYADFVAHGVRSGELRHADPVFLYIATIGMCEFFNAGAAIVRYAKPGESREALSGEYLDFILDLVFRGLQPR
jgi:AcrR family transcriptional regulator